MAMTGGDRAARRIDVKLNILLRILRLQKQHLRDDQIGDLVVDRRPEKMMLSFSSRE